MGLLDWFRSAARPGAENPDISTIPEAAGESAEIAGLNFKDAVMAHQRWKTRLQACIDGTSQEKLDPGMVSRDDQCVLGKWINGAGADRFGGVRAFAQLKAEHAQFHLIAGEVLTEVYAGKTAQAAETLRAAFTQSSARVQVHLATLFLQARE